MLARVLLTAAYVAVYGYCTTLPGFEPKPPTLYTWGDPTTTVVTPDPDAWYAAVRAAELARERETAIDRVMAHEGDYANNSKDPGGPTRFGITWRTARRFGYTGRMDRMPPDVARGMYRALWAESGADRFDGPELQFQAFDAYINHGPRAKRWADMGASSSAAACASLNAQRLRAYRSDPHWSEFGRGWTRRIEENLTRCA